MDDPLQGPNQAEAMLHRVSPEGRARARKAQQEQQKRTMRLIGRCAAATAAVGAGLYGVDIALGALSAGVLEAAGGALLASWGGIAWLSRPKPVHAAQLGTVTLTALPDAAIRWIEAHRGGLPQAALRPLDALIAQIESMKGQLHGLDAQTPAGDAVRRLMATELPDLVERYESLPPSMRNGPADAHLLRGLDIVARELKRMSDDLARGDLDALATQDRFLELKYESDEISRL